MYARMPFFELEDILPGLILLSQHMYVPELQTCLAWAGDSPCTPTPPLFLGWVPCLACAHLHTYAEHAAPSLFSFSCACVGAPVSWDDSVWDLHSLTPFWFGSWHMVANDARTAHRVYLPGCLLSSPPPASLCHLISLLYLSRTNNNAGMKPRFKGTEHFNLHLDSVVRFCVADNRHCAR